MAEFLIFSKNLTFKKHWCNTKKDLVKKLV